jgi:hypothetical protein
MILAERRSLIPIKILISNSLIHLELFENSEENLFVSSLTSEPEGVVYYATTPSLFCAFLEGTITLQTLFDKTPSLFVEINGKEEAALYSRNDMEVVLTCGDKTIKQLTNDCPIEIWYKT